MNYKLIDSGAGLKLEKFGKVLLVRPAPQAVWEPRLSKKIWDSADAVFTREPHNRWEIRKSLPASWTIEYASLSFNLKPTDFGHLGLFPEHGRFWARMQKKLDSRKDARVLNLFAYSGGASIACAKMGAKVYHLDASKGMVSWANENALMNNVSSISWIIDDVIRFLTRLVKREEKFDAIIADPPTFGRGPKGELFKIERDLPIILKLIEKLLSPNPIFFLLSAHTEGFTPLVLKQLLGGIMQSGKIEAGEMVLEGENTFILPCGAYAFWES